VGATPLTEDRGRRDAPATAEDDAPPASAGPGGELEGGVAWRILAETADSRARLDTAAEWSDSRRYCGRKSPSSSYSSYDTHARTLQWRHGRGSRTNRGRQGGNCLLPKFKPARNFFLVGNVQKYKISAENPPFWRDFGTKLKFRAPIISSVGNLQRSVGKSQLPALSPNFF